MDQNYYKSENSATTVKRCFKSFLGVKRQPVSWTSVKEDFPSAKCITPSTQNSLSANSDRISTGPNNYQSPSIVTSLPHSSVAASEVLVNQVSHVAQTSLPHLTQSASFVDTPKWQSGTDSKVDNIPPPYKFTQFLACHKELPNPDDNSNQLMVEPPNCPFNSETDGDDNQGPLNLSTKQLQPNYAKTPIFNSPKRKSQIFGEEKDSMGEGTNGSAQHQLTDLEASTQQLPSKTELPRLTKCPKLAITFVKRDIFAGRQFPILASAPRPEEPAMNRKTEAEQMEMNCIIEKPVIHGPKLATTQLREVSDVQRLLKQEFYLPTSEGANPHEPICIDSDDSSVELLQVAVSKKAKDYSHPSSKRCHHLPGQCEKLGCYCDAELPDIIEISKPGEAIRKSPLVSIQCLYLKWTLQYLK